jgi:glycylpeptide N-tetradecanoyltransferase
MDHYVEDEVGNFRLFYTKEKLRWGVKTPGMIKDLNFMVRNSKNKKIMATLVACPKKIVINGQTLKMAEVNFLAVHRKLRSKRLAQIVIQEMMRRKRKNGFPYAYYTSGHSMPTPFCTSLFMNRFINTHKLTEIRYTSKP